MVADPSSNLRVEPSVSSVLHRLGRIFRIRGMLPWGDSVPFFWADSELGPLAVAALPFECEPASHSELAFYRLVRRLSSLSGRGLPRLVRHGVEDGLPYLAFRQPTGRLLSQHLGEGRVPSHVLLRIADTLLDAFAKAHAVGLVHGELAPECVLVDERDEAIGVTLLGLGFAATIDDALERDPRSRASLRAPAYSSHRAPEVLAGAPPSIASDIYALGAVMHHMVSGRPPGPFEGEEAYGDVPALLEVVRRAMSAEPSKRYESATAMRGAISWVDIASDRLDASRQDIPLWMEESTIGDIPVPELIRRSSAPPPPVPASLPPLAPSLTNAAILRPSLAPLPPSPTSGAPSRSTPPPAWSESVPRPMPRSSAPPPASGATALTPSIAASRAPLSNRPSMPAIPPPPRLPTRTDPTLSKRDSIFPDGTTFAEPPLPKSASLPPPVPARRTSIPPVAPIANAPDTRSLPPAPITRARVLASPTTSSTISWNDASNEERDFEIDVVFDDEDSLVAAIAKRRSAYARRWTIGLVLAGCAVAIGALLAR